MNVINSESMDERDVCEKVARPRARVAVKVSARLGEVGGGRHRVPRQNTHLPSKYYAAVLHLHPQPVRIVHRERSMKGHHDPLLASDRSGELAS
jgi:hypothetical protein